MTNKQKLRRDVIEAKGDCCTYCGIGPLYGRELQITFLEPSAPVDVKNSVPMCNRCVRDREFMSNAEFVAECERRIAMETNALLNHVKLYGGVKPKLKKSPLGVKRVSNEYDKAKRRKLQKLVKELSEMLATD